MIRVISHWNSQFKCEIFQNKPTVCLYKHYLLVNNPRIPPKTAAAGIDSRIIIVRVQTVSELYIRRIEILWNVSEHRMWTLICIHSTWLTGKRSMTSGWHIPCLSKWTRASNLSVSWSLDSRNQPQSIIFDNWVTSQIKGGRLIYLFCKEKQCML